MNRSRARIYTRIRERYWELTRKGATSQTEAVAIIASDLSVNVLGYKPSYILDIVARIDPVRNERRKKILGNSR